MLKFKNRKGMTVIEVIVSLTILAIISTPVLMLFTSSILTVRHANEGIKLNSIMRIVKENVTNSVVYGGGNVLYTYDYTVTTGAISLKIIPNRVGDVPTYGNFKIIDAYNETNPNYKFDAVCTNDYASISGFPNTCEYLITIKRISDSAEVKKFRTLIFKQPGT